MIPREIQPTLKRFLKTFPVVLVGGSRQVGKTTLIKNLLKNTHKYVLLEDPDERALAQNDPRTFLEHYSPPVIIDEFQNVPELLSYLQGAVDKNRMKKGQYVLTGSQNFLMMEQVTQSLAGRVGILALHGLNSNEIPKNALVTNEQTLGHLLIRGSYPELWAELDIRPHDWFGAYIQTYLERDLRRLVNVGDLNTFEKFIRVCATRTGQNLNLSEMAKDSGTTPSTAERWFSVLESTHLVKKVMPYHANLSSRIKKTPKLYFMDTGLASYLMGFRDSQSLLHSSQYGALFETLVVSNWIKKQASHAENTLPMYLQTKSKIGVDLVIESKTKVDLIEIKANRTLQPKLAENLSQTKKALKNKVRHCFLAGLFDESRKFSFQDVSIEAKPWFKI